MNNNNDVSFYKWFTIKKILPEIAKDIAKGAKLDHNKINELIDQLINSQEKIDLIELSNQYPDREKIEKVRLLLEVFEFVHNRIKLFYSSYNGKATELDPNDLLTEREIKLVFIYELKLRSISTSNTYSSAF